MTAQLICRVCNKDFSDYDLSTVRGCGRCMKLVPFLLKADVKNHSQLDAMGRPVWEASR